jgi:UDP-galactopyranose mutase
MSMIHFFHVLRRQVVSFIGRLATYRYYNMDQVVGMPLAEFENRR